MKLSQVDWIKVGKAAVREYNKDDVPGLASEMAYHFVFALFPFIIFLAAVAGLAGSVLGGDELFESIMATLYGALQSMWGVALPIWGHRDVGATACPGENLYRQLPSIREGGRYEEDSA